VDQHDIDYICGILASASSNGLNRNTFVDSGNYGIPRFQKYRGADIRYEHHVHTNGSLYIIGRTMPDEEHPVVIMEIRPTFSRGQHAAPHSDFLEPRNEVWAMITNNVHPHRRGAEREGMKFDTSVEDLHDAALESGEMPPFPHSVVNLSNDSTTRLGRSMVDHVSFYAKRGWYRLDLPVAMTAFASNNSQPFTLEKGTYLVREIGALLLLWPEVDQRLSGVAPIGQRTTNVQHTDSFLGRL
jgi:hypothetical protein